MTRRAEAVQGIAVIYPGEGEVIAASRCRFLIDAPDRRVEIAVDGDGWRSCRRGDGYWWFDGSGLEPGRHQALVRCEGTRDGDESILSCRFLVAASPTPAPRRSDRRTCHWKSIPSG